MSGPETRTHPLSSAGRPAHVADGAVILSERNLDMAQVMARRSADGDRRLISGLPKVGGKVELDGATVLGVQPFTWLYISPNGDKGTLAAKLRRDYRDVAVVVDQSCGRTALSVSGIHAAQVLSKYCRLDLLAPAFGNQDVLATQVAHVSCIIHKTRPENAYELLVGSTFAQWLLDALVAGSEEFGCTVRLQATSALKGGVHD